MLVVQFGAMAQSSRPPSRPQPVPAPKHTRAYDWLEQRRLEDIARAQTALTRSERDIALLRPIARRDGRKSAADRQLHAALHQRLAHSRQIADLRVQLEDLRGKKKSIAAR